MNYANVLSVEDIVNLVCLPKQACSRYAGGIMRMTRLFTKTLRELPREADTVNAKLLIQGGFVNQEMAGVYSYLPLGLRVLRNISQIVREEMDILGAEEILMPALHPKAPWETTGGWDSI